MLRAERFLEGAAVGGPSELVAPRVLLLDHECGLGRLASPLRHRERREQRRHRGDHQRHARPRGDQEHSEQGNDEQRLQAVDDEAPQPQPPERERPPLAHDEQAADAVHGDGGGHCRERDCRRLAPARPAREPDDPCRQPLNRGQASLGEPASPHGLRPGRLRRHPRGEPDERAAEQCGEDDRRRRGGVPAARPQLDDDALCHRRGGEQRSHDRQRSVDLPAGKHDPGCGQDRGEQREPERDPRPAGRVGNSRAGAHRRPVRLRSARRSRPNLHYRLSTAARSPRPPPGRGRRSLLTAAVDRDRQRQRHLVTGRQLRLQGLDQREGPRRRQQ